MKHFLNLPPTVKYRKGSSFMFKITVILLYLLPISLTLLMVYRYQGNVQPAEFLATAQEDLEKATDRFQKQLLEIRPDMQMAEAQEKRLLDYYRALSGFSFSWNFLLASMEKVLPEKVRITRLTLRPQSVLKIGISGEAQSLKELTEFVRALQQVESFIRPRIHRHQLVKAASGSWIQFEVGFGFVPESEFDSL